MQAKARMQDVAKLAGVGLMTVSRALNKSGPVSEETRRRVHEAIATLNYRPNEATRSASPWWSTTLAANSPPSAELRSTTTTRLPK